MPSSHRKILATLLIIAGIVAAFALVRSRGATGDARGETDVLQSVSRITHGHGLAVDVGDPNRLYIATHEGLLILMNERDLFRVGRTQDDLMGFSAHPTDPRAFWSSGHPRTGGNLGVKRSDDGGVTWKRIAAGARGPVDFHAMSVSPVNPDLLYGWYAGALQRSVDGGRSWEDLAPSLRNVIQIVADPAQADRVYAATLDGLFASADRGATWTSVSDQLRGGAVVAIAAFPDRPQEMLSFSERGGLARSGDGGISWAAVPERFGGDAVLFFAVSRAQPDTVYALTETNALYRSTDRGIQWERVRITE